MKTVYVPCVTADDYGGCTQNVVKTGVLCEDPSTAEQEAEKMTVLMNKKQQTFCAGRNAEYVPGYTAWVMSVKMN